MPTSGSLYARLGGYDSLAAVANDLLPRLRGDNTLGRFWAHRGADGIEREKQLLINFLAANAGGPMVYTGRDMLTTHRGMGIDENDWQAFIGHLKATLNAFNVPEQETSDVLGFMDSLKSEVLDG